MSYVEFIPTERLRPFVKCYYLLESTTEVILEDKAYATGCIEFMFNLGTGKWQTARGTDFKTSPTIELWGQIIQPLHFRVLGKNTMMGIRFYPHTAAIFLNDNASLFNNRVTDLSDVIGASVRTLHEKLYEAITTGKRIELIEEFLLTRLRQFENKHAKIDLLQRIMVQLQQEDFLGKIESVANQHGISARYLQKLFKEHTGVGPKLYGKINRFQKSLQLVAQKNASLTTIAYECGYYDQSHFIREFKSFTGHLPSEHTTELYAALIESTHQ